MADGGEAFGGPKDTKGNDEAVRGGSGAADESRPCDDVTGARGDGASTEESHDGADVRGVGADGFGRSDADAADDERTASERAEDEEFDAAIKAIVSSGLIAGPDPSIVDDIVAGREGGEDAADSGLGDSDAADSGEEAPVGGLGRSEDGPDGNDEPGEDREVGRGTSPGGWPAGAAAVTAPREAYEAAERLAIDRRVGEIYASILTRSPEHKVQPSLERVRAALDMMGNPQHAYRAIHITGTNGKTSTARIVEALLRERGLRTGRFTSPHLSTVRERMSIDGLAIGGEDFIATWEDVEPFIEMVDAASLADGGPRMSFFEVFTVMAYAAFANAPVDVAVVEVGMGGRWDATNVIDADVAIIGPVAVDHERWLGCDLEDIASEKVGIIKPGATVVCAEQADSVEEIVAEAVSQSGARLVAAGSMLGVVSREMAVGGQLVTIRTPSALYEDIPLALRGAHQADNAALAIAAVEAFFGGAPLDGGVLEHALMSVSSPGRLETVRTSPAVVVDAAHNPHGAEATVQALREYFPGRLVGVVAMMADKDAEGFFGALEPHLEAAVVTGIDSPRAMEAELLGEVASEVFGQDRVEVEHDLLAAIDRAAEIAEADSQAPMTAPAVVVMGSIQLVGLARQLMGRSVPDGG
ncbi:MAG: cyanophycin synthetase [Actinomycetaceae bacterium]|nr:cyanophycin synthetase [Actinomycetaceae bacterium]